MRFKGKNAIVTGASGGIGSAVARYFAGEGANLCLVDRRAVAEIAKEVRAQGGNVVEITDMISPPPALTDPKVAWRRREYMCAVTAVRPRSCMCIGTTMTEIEVPDSWAQRRCFGGQSQAAVARRASSRASRGVFHPRVRRGRVLRLRATV